MLQYIIVRKTLRPCVSDFFGHHTIPSYVELQCRQPVIGYETHDRMVWCPAIPSNGGQNSKVRFRKIVPSSQCQLATKLMIFTKMSFEHSKNTAKTQLGWQKTSRYCIAILNAKFRNKCCFSSAKLAINVSSHQQNLHFCNKISHKRNKKSTQAVKTSAMWVFQRFIMQLIFIVLEAMPLFVWNERNPTKQNIQQRQARWKWSCCCTVLADVTILLYDSMVWLGWIREW